MIRNYDIKKYFHLREVLFYSNSEIHLSLTFFSVLSFIFVHSVICHNADFINLLAVFRINGIATACINAQQTPLYIKRPVNGIFYSSDHHLTEFIINIALLNDQGKFISTDTESIVCLPDTFAQSPGNRLQQSVPHVMSISVINRLKPVQIQIEHGKFFA